MIVVGVTGSFSSGKSAVTAIFKKLGARVFDADLTAKKATRKGTAVFRAIVQIFGKEYLGIDGQINRRKLARRVFSHPKDLRTLNILVHPEVIFEALKARRQMKSRKNGILVLDVPLLYESRMEKLADVIVVVDSSKKDMIRRGRQKGMEPALSKKILKTQWPFEKKARRADFVIQNHGNLKELEEKARQIFREIKNLKTTEV